MCCELPTALCPYSWADLLAWVRNQPFEIVVAVVGVMTYRLVAESMPRAAADLHADLAQLDGYAVGH